MQAQVYSWSIWISFSNTKVFLELLSKQKGEKLYFQKRNQNREISLKWKLVIFANSKDARYGQTDGQIPSGLKLHEIDTFNS